MYEPELTLPYNPLCLTGSSQKLHFCNGGHLYPSLAARVNAPWQTADAERNRSQFGFAEYGRVAATYGRHSLGSLRGAIRAS